MHLKFIHHAAISMGMLRGHQCGVQRAAVEMDRGRPGFWERGLQCNNVIVREDDCWSGSTWDSGVRCWLLGDQGNFSFGVCDATLNFRYQRRICRICRIEGMSRSYLL